MEMKIFFPVQVFYPSQAGGPANSVYWVTKNLSRHGFQPIVVATDQGLPSDIPLNRWVASDGGKVIYIKTRFISFPIRQIFVSLTNFFRADVVHLSSFFFPTAFLTALAARLLKKKIVWSVRGELDPQALNFSRLKKLPVLWCIKKLIGIYPVFHSTCDEETLNLKHTFSPLARIVQIPNFIELPELVERTAAAAPYLLYIGRIHPKKAIDNLIRGLSLSKEFLRSNFVLKIAGKGQKEDENNLLNLVTALGLADKIVFVGQVEGPEKQRLLADAYFTLMPSHTENFGLVVLESLAQNTPVLASQGTPWKVLETEQIGFWPENSPESLAQTIDFILKMPADEYESCRRRCRNFVEQKFDIRQKVARWIEMYQNLD
jgi:glycosyltransferase involved in cell wall biosynthesis